MSPIIKLFDIQNDVVIPTEHCYMISYLKDIMIQRPDDYLKMFGYLFYMSCPNPVLNPYFNLAEDEKEETILKDIDADFSSEDDLLINALPKIQKLYQTTTSRNHTRFKNGYDRLGKYIEQTPIDHGRDGNFSSIIAAMKSYDSIRESFQSAEKAVIEEQQAMVRGGQRLAYDQ